MFLIAVIVKQILILLGSLVLFFVAYILYNRSKLPKGVEAPEKCNSCLSNSCIIKSGDVEKIKEELRKEIDNCEGIHEA